MTKTPRAFIIATIAVAVFSSHAAADPMHWTGTGKGSWATWSLAGDPLGDPFSDFAGEITWSWYGVPPSGYDASFYTYCVDATQYLFDGQDATLRSTDALIGPGGGPLAGREVAWLLNTYAPTIHATGSNDDAAALQIAIWEVLYDSSPDLSAGNFRLLTTGPIFDTSAAYLSQLSAAGQSGYSVSATWLDVPGGQDQVVMSPVPEPASMLLLASGLGVGIYRRRRSTHGR